MSWSGYRYSDWFGQPILYHQKVEGGIGIPPCLARFCIQFLNGSFCGPLLFSKAIHDIIRDVFIVYKNGSDYKVVGWQLIGKTS